MNTLALRNGHRGEEAVQQLVPGTLLLVPRIRRVHFKSTGIRILNEIGSSCADDKIHNFCRTLNAFLTSSAREG